MSIPPEMASLHLRGDPLRLGQVLLNLVSNAVKFTMEGNIAVRVSQEKSVDDGLRLKFEVKDSGIGIAPDDQQRIFNAFEQGDGSMTRQYGGSGLGLTICKRLVQMMGGEIGVESTPGQGSVFRFTVRMDESSEAVPPAPTFISALVARHPRR